MAMQKWNPDSVKDFKQINRFKVTDGDNTFRILPPFGEDSDGYAFKKWTLVWLTDPNTGKKRPYASPASVGIKTPCPAYEFTTQLKSRLETARVEFVSNLVSEGAKQADAEEQAKKAFHDLNTILRDITPKVSYFYNAATKSGECGLLELKTSAHKDLKAVFVEYFNMYNLDPTSLQNNEEENGIWINVNKTGNMFDTKYKVAKKQVPQKGSNGKILVGKFEDDTSPLPERIIQNYESEAIDLTKLYKLTTYEEMKQALTESLAPLLVTYPELNLPGWFEEAKEEAPKPEPKSEPKAPKKAPSKWEMEVEDEEDDFPFKGEKPANYKPTSSKQVDDDLDAAARLLED